MMYKFFGFEKADIRLMLSIWRMSLGDRYLGSALGGAWAILNPLLMMALFTFVFGFVYKARLPGSDTTLGYAIWLICGYGPWLANTEAITAAAQSIVSNAGLVKNMAFRTEILPLSATLLGLVPLSVSLGFLMLLQIVSGELLSFQVLWLPFLIIVQFLFLAAVGVMLSLVTAFVRDFGILLPNLLMIVLFATPIFYSLNAVPEAFAIVSRFNPIYVISEGYRSVLIAHEQPDLFSLFILMIFSIALLLINLKIFRRVKGFLPSAL